MQPLSGQALIADFQTVFVSSATIEAAQYEAARSENAMVQQLQAMSSGMYLNPGNLTAQASGDDLTRASLDAHIKKVQAQQLDAMNAAQLQSLIASNRTRYNGKKVRVISLHKATKPFDIVWFDQQHGYRTTAARKTTITGTIEDVLLDRNILILKPHLSTRLLNGRLQNYLAYIIDPNTLQPLVDIKIL